MDATPLSSDIIVDRRIESGYVSIFLAFLASRLSALHVMVFGGISSENTSHYISIKNLFRHSIVPLSQIVQ